jgi:hypothetical protein
MWAAAVRPSVAFGATAVYLRHGPRSSADGPIYCLDGGPARIHARFRRIHAGDRGYSLPSPGPLASLSLFRVEPKGRKSAGVAGRKMR